MERNRKLKAYEGKDYSNIVRFPVRLMDRDGIVRSYTYQESVDVYQRRIETAAWRHSDPEIIGSEIDHCLRRIDQIEHSFRIQRKHANTRMERELAKENLTPALVIGVFERLLYPHGRSVGDLSCSCWAVDPGSGHIQVEFGEGLVFDLIAGDDAKAPWTVEPAPAQSVIWQGELGGPMGEVEDGIARYAWVLAEDGLLGDLVDIAPHREVWRGEDGDSIELLPDDLAQPWWVSWLDREEQAHSPARVEFSRAMEALVQADLEEAIGHLEDSLGQDPYYVDAYLSLISLLVGGSRFDEAALVVEQAVRYIPEDSRVRHVLGLVRLRDGDIPGAEAEVQRALALDADCTPARMFWALLLARRGQWRQGSRVARARLERSEEPRRMRELSDWLEEQHRIRRWYRRAGAGLLVLGAVLSPFFFKAGMTFGGCGLLVAGVMAPVLDRYLRRKVLDHLDMV